MTTGAGQASAPFERRTGTYFHLTSWNAEQIKIGAYVYWPCWAESTYWQHQHNLEQATDFLEQDLRRAAAELVAAGVNCDWRALAGIKARAQRDKEDLFERVRAEEYPDRPSRQDCIFLCESRDALDDYLAKYHFGTLGKSVLEIEMVEYCDKKTDDDLTKMGLDRRRYDVLNSMLRCRVNPNFDCQGPGVDQVAAARRYWRGDETSPGDITEILFYGFFRVHRVLSAEKPPA